MKRKTKLVTGFVILMLIVTPLLFVPGTTKTYAESDTSPVIANGSDSFTPTMSKPAWVDWDNNGIADGLDHEIAARVVNGTGHEYVNIIVMLKSAPTAHDAAAFASSGGYVTAGPWTMALYGFGGTIPYDDIGNFINQCPDVLLIEKDAVVLHSQIAYAVEQVGARPYVWNTLGLHGDSNSSIAIVDTGIDASHPDFSSGFGDQNFSRKIVGWNDQIDQTTTPFDDDGHGSHCAGLAAGDGFFSVDSSGNAIATWGADLHNITSTLLVPRSAMIVNKTGTITISAQWMTTGTATLQSFQLYRGNNNLDPLEWTFLASEDTHWQQNWMYTLTYDVTSIPYGFDVYHVLLRETQGTGDLYVMFTVSWPYAPPADGFSAWTGIAPQAKLVGVKVLNGNGSGEGEVPILQGIQWIINNRKPYHITVASMSFDTYPDERVPLENAVANLVNSGVTVVAAAGNHGPGGNNIVTPGSVPEVITVAAMDQFDNIADFSSQGGWAEQNHFGYIMKPDITAPGGSSYAASLFSADSNYNDANGGWLDLIANDSAPKVGTSMATPIVAGAANIVIQAMGGCANWQWTRSQALQPKMILLMTATETYPNLREIDYAAGSPILDRGGKDVHEGYGRLNLDAAVEAITKNYLVGSTATDTLGRPPTLTDVSVLGQRLAWARNVQLVSGFQYNFTLTVPAGADYDLYLYNNTGNPSYNGTAYGEPGIVANSTTAATGGTETFNITAPYTGQYYIVVKRATETTGTGNFTLTSSGLHPLFAMKTLSDGWFYKPNCTLSLIRVEETFTDNRSVGDQEGRIVAGYPLSFPDGHVKLGDLTALALGYKKDENESGWNYQEDFAVPDRYVGLNELVWVAFNYGPNGDGSWFTPGYPNSGIRVEFTFADSFPRDFEVNYDGFVSVPWNCTGWTVHSPDNGAVGAFISFWGNG